MKCWMYPFLHGNVLFFPSQSTLYYFLFVILTINVMDEY
ncbi:hypothetical protein HMPREF9412_5849 [Paenibacillus sp. HGF5]|nr:hypothetical protein HMPREF9412_5849 [Paenibacillus sp. HGF5]